MAGDVTVGDRVRLEPAGPPPVEGVVDSPGSPRRLPSRIAEQGGRVVAGLGLEPSDTATAIRGDLITDGPFIETRSTS